MTPSDGDLRERVRRVLIQGGVDAGPREADWILEEAERRAQGARGRSAVITEAVEMAARRAAGEPLQYVLGSQAFRHLVLEVGPGVFIPRPETEVVAGRAMDLLPQRAIAVDLCTGSGAIALSIVDERPDAVVFATDMSSEAMRYARRNAARIAPEPEQRERFLEGDLFAPLPPDMAGRVDVVVANPPYIAPREAEVLPKEVVAHEPPHALFAGDEGFDVIDRIARQAPGWLAPGATLVLEIGEKQGPEARRRIEATEAYDDLSVETDLAGKDRVLIARTAAPWAPVARALTKGNVALVPTDTVYGIAGSVSSPAAIEGIFALKERSREKALPVLVHNIEAAARLGRLDEMARGIAASYWPGPLTLVVRRAPGFSTDLGGADPSTIALRVPDHPELLRLLGATGPLAVTSANVSGESAATTLAEARASFPELAAMSGAGGAGRESTVLSLVGEPRVLRPGALSEEAVMTTLQNVRS